MTVAKVWPIHHVTGSARSKTGAATAQSATNLDFIEKPPEIPDVAIEIKMVFGQGGCP